jgi:hypothetical protein
MQVKGHFGFGDGFGDAGVTETPPKPRLLTGGSGGDR